MRRNFYFYGLGLLTLLGAGGIATYATLAGAPQVTQQAPRAQTGLKPQKAEVEAEYLLDVAAAKSSVKVKVTAPDKGTDAANRAFPIKTVDRIDLYRSSETESEALIHSWENVAAGEVVEYLDEDQLECGDYTYSTRPYIGENEGARAYVQVECGIIPADPEYPELTSANGFAPVTVSYKCPALISGSIYYPVPFPEGVTYSEIRLFQKESNGEEKVLDSHLNPAPGDEFTYVDENAVLGNNYYYLRVYTPFGHSDAVYSRIFLGPDYPGKVTNVKAVESDGSVIVTWDAPSKGFNEGFIDPEKMMYKVYRCDNDYFSNPTLLTDAATECRYVDKLEGLTGETMLYYRIFPYNDVEAPAGTYNYGETDNGVLAGPPAQLPFSENFNDGSKFNRVTQNNWEEDFNSYSFSCYYLRDHATVENSGREQDIECGVDGPGTPESGPDNFLLVTSGNFTSSTEPGSLTTGNLSFADTYNPIVSFWYVPVAGSKARVSMQMATGEYDAAGAPVFEEIYAQPYGKTPEGEDVDAAVPMQWVKVSVPVTSYAGKHSSKLRFAFNFDDPSEGRFPMLFDQVEINDYPGAVDLAAEQNEDKILLSWVLPESAAGKKPLFKIWLDGEEIAETEDCSYLYEGAEQGDTYGFAVTTTYPEGVEGPKAEAEPLTVPVTDFTVDGMYYVVMEDKTLSLQRFESTADAAVIPDEVTFKDFSFKVTHVLPMLFQGQRSLKSLDVQAQLEELPQELCYGCVALESVKLPATVKEIGDLAFFGCASLETIELPAGVERIASGAFQNCLKLKEIAFGEALTEIDTQAFSRCQALAKVSFATAVPPTVGTDAFKGIAEGCVGECPEGAEDAYSAVAELSPIKFPTSGVQAVDLDGAVSVDYFTTAGVRVAKPAPGQTVIVRVSKADGSVKTGKALIR